MSTGTGSKTLFFDHVNGRAYEAKNGTATAPVEEMGARKLLSDLVTALTVEFEYGVYEGDLDKAWKAARSYLTGTP